MKIGTLLKDDYGNIFRLEGIDAKNVLLTNTKSKKVELLPRSSLDSWYLKIK